MNTTFKVKTLFEDFVYYETWVTCEEYEIMGFIFRVGVNSKNPNEVGLFVHKSAYWIKINLYSWSTIENTCNDFIPFFVKKDITDFLLRHFNLNTIRKDRKFLVENEILKEEILEILKYHDTPFTATEISQQLCITCQRASALLLQMANDNLIQRIKYEKKVVYKY